MPRSAVLFLVTLLLCLGTAGSATAKAATPLSATVTQCTPAKDASGGQAVFVGSMPLVRGAATMEMQFALLRSDATSAAPVALALPKWGVWLKAEAGRSGFVYSKRVQGLQGPAVYRALIRFRWKDVSGKVVRSVKRQTARCGQPDLRPNLVPGTITGQTVAGGQARYTVVVRNAGLSAAGPFAALLRLDDASQVRDEIAGLDAGERSTVSFTGAQCSPGGLLEATLDPDGLVAESDETDNTVDVVCPLS